MGSRYDSPDPRDRRPAPPRGGRPYGEPPAGQPPYEDQPPPPPRGRAPLPPDRGGRRRGETPPPHYPAGRVSMPREIPDPYDEPRRPSSIGRARVRPVPGREPVSPVDPFEPEPVTAVARVGEPRPPQAGRHAARSVLPSGLSIRRALRLRGRMLATSFAVLLVLMGSGVVAGAAFLDSVQLSNELDFPETTTVLYSDGSVLSRLGEVTRYELPYERISPHVKAAIVASEDESFWTNQGIDVAGVLRAAWNNFTGGSIQGASTITQQYARIAYELGRETSYQRKLKEAVLAWKMGQSMTKEEILTGYLNAVSFGRQAYGVEAAARAFFKKSADTQAIPEQQLTLAEAIVLVAMVKQPYPDPRDPVGSPGYDPTVSEAAAANARDRFNYVANQLRDTGVITPEEREALTFPEGAVVPYEPAQDNKMTLPEGHIVRQALSELTYTEGSPFYGSKDWKYIMEGGYQIRTTIHPGAQAAAVAAASRQWGLLGNQPDNLQAALVAVQPLTGRVLAYYGGDDGTGADFAGTYKDENGDVLGVGYHPPGSSFKVYTLAAALNEGISLNSYWRWQPYDMPGREGNNRIRNSARCGSLAADDETPCSLLQSVISSVNVPFYQLTLTVGPADVLEVAKAAGINAMYNDARERIDLTELESMEEVVPEEFAPVLGIGQYPITVLDHANGMATMAAVGQRARAHFVERVTKGDQVIWGETLAEPTPVLDPRAANNLAYALSQVQAAKTNFGWDTAGKTGTWELYNSNGENAHAWMVGFSRSLAAAVWVGNRGDEQALRDANGNKIAGAGLPATIWRQFMAEATNALGDTTTPKDFNNPNGGGDVLPSGAVPSPTPTFELPPGWPELPPGWPTIPGWPPTRGIGERD